MNEHNCKENELLCSVVERYIYYQDMSNIEDEIISSTVNIMINIVIAEMWMLTQN